MASAMLTSSSQIGSVRPFVAGKSSARPRAAPVQAIRASAEPNKVAKSLFATLTAASIAVSGPALAFDLPGFSVGRDRDEGAASKARDFLDKNEDTGPRVQSRGTDPNSGKVDTYDSSGTQQADARYPGGREPKSGPNTFMSAQTQADKLPATRGPGAGGAADSKFDPKDAVIKANERGPTNAFSTATAFTPFNTSALQKDVAFGIGEVGTTAQQAEGKGKELQGSSASPDTSAKQAVKNFSNEAKSVFSNPAGPGQSKLAAEKISEANSQIPKALAGDKNAKPVAFNGFDAASLQRSAGMEV